MTAATPSPVALGVPYLGHKGSVLPGFGRKPYDSIRAAMMLRSLHAEMTARLQVLETTPIALPRLVAAVEDGGEVLSTWKRLTHDGDEATRAILIELDPLAAFAELAAHGRDADIRLLLEVAPGQGLLNAGSARANLARRVRFNSGVNFSASAMFTEPVAEAARAAASGPRSCTGEVADRLDDSQALGPHPVLFSAELRNFAAAQAQLMGHASEGQRYDTA